MFVSCQHVLFFPFAKAGLTLSIFHHKIHYVAQKSDSVHGDQAGGVELLVRADIDFVQVDKNMSVPVM